ncbi:conserved hypothetical protein [Trichinella spiralis]|uniref:hypothetical protein n=1 Tax=Trichinella spiralis TaxID=6334 RepID=UPI0001EFCDD8|nr:conserved hypothetical protein [Trichinella spiralis]
MHSSRSDAVTKFDLRRKRTVKKRNCKVVALLFLLTKLPLNSSLHISHCCEWTEFPIARTSALLWRPLSYIVAVCCIVLYCMMKLPTLQVEYSIAVGEEIRHGRSNKFNKANATTSVAL